MFLSLSTYSSHHAQRPSSGIISSFMALFFFIYFHSSKKNGGAVGGSPVLAKVMSGHHAGLNYSCDSFHAAARDSVLAVTSFSAFFVFAFVPLALMSLRACGFAAFFVFFAFFFAAIFFLSRPYLVLIYLHRLVQVYTSMKVLII